MSKKKHRKQAERKDSSISAPTKKAPDLTTRFSPRSFTIIFFVAFVIIGILAYLFFLKKSSDQSSINSNQMVATNAASVLESLSRIDFTGMEAQVVEKIKKLQKQVLENPQSASAWGKLAINLDIHDLKNESILCYKQAASLDPNEFRWQYYPANVLYELGSPEALQLFERSLALRPDSAQAHIRYGHALFQAKRLEEASREFNAACNSEGGSYDAYLGLARIALSQGTLEVARTNLQKALESNPNHSEVHGLLSEVYRRLNMPEDAHRELLTSQKLPKKKPLTDKFELEMIAEGVSSYWYEQRGRAYLEQGSYEAAIQELKLAVETVSDPRLNTTLGVAYLHWQKYPEAAEQFNTALALNPKSVYAMNNLAAAFFEMHKVEEAIFWLKKAIQIQPDFASSYEHLGKLYLRLGKKPEAVQAYRRGNERLPDDPNLALQLAWMLATSSDFSLRNGSKSIQLAEVICKNNNYQDPQSLEVLAAAHAEKGEFANAAKFAQRGYEIAAASGQVELANRIKGQLKYYEGSTPYRE